MMLLLFISAVVTFISYLAVQHHSSQRMNGRHGAPGPAPQDNNVPLLFVIFLVTLIGGHWVSGWMSGEGGSLIGGGGSSSAHEDLLVKTIPSGIECHVGPVPF